MLLTKIGQMAGIVANVIDSIRQLIFEAIYKLVSFFFLLLDLIQSIFRKFAGIEPMYTGTGTGEYDIITTLLTTDVIRNALLSVMLLAAILLIMFSIFAIVKQQYAVQPEPVGTIIGRSIRALFGFLFIPILCVCGVYMGNIILDAIDGATAAGNGKTMSSRIFATTSYEANYLRGDISDENKLSMIRYYATSDAIKLMPELANYTNPTVSDIETVANIIDTGFETRFEDADNGIYINLEDDTSYYNPTARWRDAYYHHINNDVIERMPYRDIGLVEAFYDTTQINYLFMIIAIFFTGYALSIMTFGVINRIFNLTILYAISPALLALYPLDNGAAIGKWKNDFISNTIVAYSAVGVFNLFLQVLELVDYIKPFATATLAKLVNPTLLSSSNMLLAGGLMNSIVQLIVMICGCYMVNGIISKIGGYIGGGDAMSEGKSNMGNFNKTRKTATQIGVETFEAGKETAKYKSQNKKGFFGKLGGTVGGFVSGVTGSVFDRVTAGSRGEIKEAKKKAIESIDNKRKGAGQATYSSDPKARAIERQTWQETRDQWNGTNSQSNGIFRGANGNFDFSKIENNQFAKTILGGSLAEYKESETENQRISYELNFINNKAADIADIYKQAGTDAGMNQADLNLLIADIQGDDVTKRNSAFDKIEEEIQIKGTQVGKDAFSKATVTNTEIKGVLKQIKSGEDAILKQKSKAVQNKVNKQASDINETLDVINSMMEKGLDVKSYQDGNGNTKKISAEKLESIKKGIEKMASKK